MEYLLEWAWQIICCLIFITVLSNLLPKTGYEKYIRLFSGMVLILLIFVNFRSIKKPEHA